jgi:hypothetical protein
MVLKNFTALALKLTIGGLAPGLTNLSKAFEILSIRSNLSMHGNQDSLETCSWCHAGLPDFY